MASQVQGVVAMKKGAPVSLVTIVVPDPGPGEAVVRIQACGVCHTDLHYREGGINDEFPFLLGHEAAGVVESVGSDVTSVQPGDFVVLNWRAVCGECRSCRRGRPWYCFATHNATQKMTLIDGTSLSAALGIGAFAEKTLVAAGHATQLTREARRSQVACWAVASWPDSAQRCTLAKWASATRWRCSVAGAWAARQSPERASPERRPSSRSTSTPASSMPLASLGPPTS